MQFSEYPNHVENEQQQLDYNSMIPSNDGKQWTMVVVGGIKTA